MKLNKHHLLAAAVLAALPVAANAVNFTAPAIETVNNISVFDWAPANVFADQGNAAFVNFVNSAGACPAGSCNFTAYSHGKLSNFLNSSNLPIANTQGVNYQVTYQLQFGETVIGGSVFPGSNIAVFGFNAAVPNSFSMYYNPVLAASDLSGAGFGPGILMLSGGVTPNGAFTSSFLASTAPGSIVNLGSSVPGVNAAGWGAAQTVSGSGASSTIDLFVAPTFVNPLFFGSQTITSFLLSSISNNLPFTTVDPSLSFPEAGIPNTIPVVLGPVMNTNGGTYVNASGVLVADAPSLLFQTDTNSPVTSVPEPATLALLGIGLAGLGIAGLGRKRRNQA